MTVVVGRRRIIKAIIIGWAGDEEVNRVMRSAFNWSLETNPFKKALASVMSLWLLGGKVTHIHLNARKGCELLSSAQPRRHARDSLPLAARYRCCVSWPDPNIRDQRVGETKPSRKCSIMFRRVNGNTRRSRQDGRRREGSRCPGTLDERINYSPKIWSRDVLAFATSYITVVF